MTFNEFARVYEKLCFAFNLEMSEGQALVYYEHLQHFPLDKLKRAAFNLSHGLKFFPKIAELIEEINSLPVLPDPNQRQLEANENIPTRYEAREIIKGMLAQVGRPMPTGETQKTP